jgi:hypothetical protein
MDYVNGFGSIGGLWMKNFQAAAYWRRSSGRSTSLPLTNGVGADECDQVGRVDHLPSVLRGLDELERDAQPGGSGSGAAGDLRAVPDGGERALDGFRGP